MKFSEPAHSLKGMAGTMGYKRMQNLTHNMENVFSEIRNDKMKVTADLVDVLFQCLDALESYVSNIQETQDEGTDDNAPIIEELNKFLATEGEAPAAAPSAPAQAAPAPEASAESTGSDAPDAEFNNLVLADFEKNAVNEGS